MNHWTHNSIFLQKSFANIKTMSQDIKKWVLMLREIYNQESLIIEMHYDASPWNHWIKVSLIWKVYIIVLSFYLNTTIV